LFEARRSPSTSPGKKKKIPCGFGRGCHAGGAKSRAISWRIALEWGCGTGEPEEAKRLAHDEA